MFISELFVLSETWYPFVLFSAGLISLSSGLTLSCRKNKKEENIENIRNILEKLLESDEKIKEEIEKLKKQLEDLESSIIFEE